LKPARQVGVRESKSSFLLYAFTVPFKGLGTVQLKKKKEMNTFIQQRHIKLIKSDSKTDVYIVIYLK